MIIGSHNRIVDLRPKIELAWSEITSCCEDLEEYLSRDKSYWQCDVTSVLVQEIFGGLLLRGLVDGKAHYWNFINGIDVDFTARQFKPGSSITDIQYVDRDDIIKNEWFERRLIILRENFKKLARG